MSRPSTEYRNDMRYAVRVFSTREEEAILAPEGVDHLVMDDLEAAYELVMHARPMPPPGYKSARS